MEFDAEQNAVIDSTHENLDIELPPKCVFAFLCLTQSMCFRYKTYINIMKSLFIKYVAYATPLVVCRKYLFITVNVSLILSPKDICYHVVMRIK